MGCARAVGLRVFASSLLVVTAACGGGAPSTAPAETPPAEAPAATAPAPGAHEVHGTAPLPPNNGVAIVTLTPAVAREFPPPDEQAEMDQVNLTFVPSVLIVRTGYPVKFLNHDDTLHNVRVREEATRQGAFNVAIPTGGDFTYTFPRDGFYIVGCDIHPEMAAAVFAASTPYVVVAGTDGAFSFPDVAPGRYTAKAFAGADTFTQEIDVTGPSTTLTISGRT